MAIYDVVEQSVQQVADAESSEIGAGVPAFDDGTDIQPVILADGDQRPRGDEGGELAGGQFSRAGVQPRSVHVQEQVSAVAVKLRALVLMLGVLHGQRVQPELLAQHSQVTVVRVTQVQPDGDRLIGEVVTDLSNRETLKLKPAIPVQPRACLAPGRAYIADRRCGHRVRITAVERLGRQRPGA